ncbi:hypothetical protein PINS_up011989 [Pythium insidiosum]|nr:hypothetical protein PINS_up011989 [Pythium insidiosum]
MKETGPRHDLVPHESADAYKLLNEFRRTRADHLEREKSFSWVSCFIALVSYALLASDVLRSGYTVAGAVHATPLETDLELFFGTYAYPVTHLVPANATAERFHKMWSYKYDTTSITMRAVSERLGLTQWPSCVLYHSKCDETKGIALNVLFKMINELIDGVRDHHHRFLTLRILHNWRDRLSHRAGKAMGQD